jgi:hypothetical protein
MAGGGTVVNAARLVPATVQVWCAAPGAQCAAPVSRHVHRARPNVVHAHRGRNPEEADDRAETVSECGV